ncbi:hypothetical protein MMC07_002769 [Pseudocyphellaria aurata]|nr:hypothetical protein [Pseudocyphellaria aurata]
MIGLGARPGQETEWRNFQYYMHYAEGGLMLLVETRFLAFCAIGAHIHTNTFQPQFMFQPQFILHFDFLESQMGNAPFLSGQYFTAADIMIIFPVEIAFAKCEVSHNDYPLLANYLQRMYQRPAFVKAMQRIINIDGQHVGLDDVVRGRPNSVVNAGT